MPCSSQVSTWNSISPPEEISVARSIVSQLKVGGRSSVGAAGGGASKGGAWGVRQAGWQMPSGGGGGGGVPGGGVAVPGGGSTGTGVDDPFPAGPAWRAVEQPLWTPS